MGTVLYNYCLRYLRDPDGKKGKMAGDKAGNAQNRKAQLAGMFLLLHAGLLIFSLSSVCSKIAGSHDLFTGPFFLWYGLLLVCLFAYAVIWQQVLKFFPLTAAYANKPVTLVDRKSVV